MNRVRIVINVQIIGQDRNINDWKLEESEIGL